MLRETEPNTALAETVPLMPEKQQTFMVVPGALVKLSSLRTRRFKLSTLVGVKDIQIPPDAPAAFLQYAPAGHGVHADDVAPPVEYDPAWQYLITVAASYSVQFFPARQLALISPEKTNSDSIVSKDV